MRSNENVTVDRKVLRQCNGDVVSAKQRESIDTCLCSIMLQEMIFHDI